VVDIKEKSKIPSPDASSAPAPEAAENSVKNQQKAQPVQKMSKGEKAYNWIVYNGVNYWLNLGMSVLITHYFSNLKGKERISQAADFIARRFSENKSSSAYHMAHHHSKTSLETFMLLSGGNILLVPMKLMEDAKRPIVHWLNKKLGVNQTAPDGHELTPDEIHIEEEQPKQSWLQVIGRRLLGIMSVVALGGIINGLFRDRTKPPPVVDEPDNHGGKLRIQRGAMEYINHVFHSGFPGGKWLATNKHAQAIMGFTILDSFFTGVTAVIMRLTNGAEKNNDKKKPQTPHSNVEQHTEASVQPTDQTQLAADNFKKSSVDKESLKAKRHGETTETVLSHVQKIAAADANPVLQPSL
jgi:hypothetical protein